ncbi:MAG: hypothetical protein PF485_11870 [Bacteroidales bacterium]|jgi:hypothetical protein|nr:hypothetical protein [Bacteroidales bacterium]
MKKFIYISGIILINLQLAGVIFKISHWPGAGVLLSLSVVLLVFLFFPIALITSYKQHKDKSQLHLYIIAYLTIAFTSLGMLFKIMHWPGARDMLIIGLILPFILFLPFYVRYHNKTKAKSDRNFFGIIFFMIYMTIISSLLAVGVSADVYRSIESQIEKSVSQSNSLELRNDRTYEALRQNPNIVSLDMLNTNADNLCNILESAKRELIIAANEKNKAVLTGKDINYDNISGGDNKDLTVSFINQKGDNTKENLIESRLIDFEDAIKNLSDKYELNEILNPKSAPYSLSVIRNNIYEGRVRSKTMIENISAFSFMQNRVRLIEYQILILSSGQADKLQN